MPAIRDRATILTGMLLARIARTYVGRWRYVFGGPPPPGTGDCSSFVSTVLHRAGLALPGPGRWGDPDYPPNAHGPDVMAYSRWAGATTVGSPQAGDLCCWVGEGAGAHIGIAVSSSEMVSALNPTDGVKVTPIADTGPSGAPLIYRRVNGLAGSPVPVATGAGASHPPLVVAGVVAAMLAGMFVLGLVAVAGGVELARRAVT